MAKSNGKTPETNAIEAERMPEPTAEAPAPTKTLLSIGREVHLYKNGGWRHRENPSLRDNHKAQAGQIVEATPGSSLCTVRPNLNTGNYGEDLQGLTEGLAVSINVFDPLTNEQRDALSSMTKESGSPLHPFWAEWPPRV